MARPGEAATGPPSCWRRSLHWPRTPSRAPARRSSSKPTNGTPNAGDGAGGDCSIIGKFRSYRDGGSFALALDLRSGVLAVVGEPPPLAATVQIDRNPKIRCTGPRYCLFGLDNSAAAARQLAFGSVALIDVETEKGILRSSVSTKGYRAALAKVRSWSSAAAEIAAAKPMSRASSSRPRASIKAEIRFPRRCASRLSGRARSVAVRATGWQTSAGSAVRRDRSGRADPGARTLCAAPSPEFRPPVMNSSPPPGFPITRGFPCPKKASASPLCFAEQ